MRLVCVTDVVKLMEYCIKNEIGSNEMLTLIERFKPIGMSTDRILLAALETTIRDRLNVNISKPKYLWLKLVHYLFGKRQVNI